MLTTSELTDALSVETASAPVNRDRLDQVRGRVAARRRRRAIGSAMTTLAIIAVVALVVIPQLDDKGNAVQPATPTPTPAVTGDVAALPDYRLGSRLVAQGAHVGSDSFTVPFTATNNHLTFTVDCYVPGTRDGDTASVMLNFDLNGISQGGGSCQGNKKYFGADPASSSVSGPTGNAAVTPGQPATLVVSFSQTVPDQSRVRVGIYEQVPLASYQFPPAPDPLPALEPTENVYPYIHVHPLVFLSAGPLPGLVEPLAHPVLVQGSWTKTSPLSAGCGSTERPWPPGR